MLTSVNIFLILYASDSYSWVVVHMEVHDQLELSIILHSMGVMWPVPTANSGQHHELPS